MPRSFFAIRTMPSSATAIFFAAPFAASSHCFARPRAYGSTARRRLEVASDSGCTGGRGGRRRGRGARGDRGAGRGKRTVPGVVSGEVDFFDPITRGGARVVVEPAI